jgi:phage baseplate assembly protein W
MSSDVRLAWVCPHRTLEEVVALQADRRSLPTRQPIAGAGSVRITANDEVLIPQGGLFVSAQLSGTVSGPFDLVAGDDRVTVTTPAGSETVSLGVLGTTRLSTDQVIKKFQQANFQVALLENINGHLVFSDISTVGPDSFVRMDGPAAYALGFGSISCGPGDRQRIARGRQAYPGWGLQVRQDTITNRYPVFNFPVTANPVFKVSYTAPKNRCLRCGGMGTENDWRFGEDGQIIRVENENLLYQACLKILLTNRGSNPYHTWYGTTLQSRIGAKAVSGMSSLISEDVRTALVKFQNLQEQQAKYQVVTFKERLYAVTSVQATPHTQDPTTWLVDVSVQNASGEPITLNIVYTVPGVVALMGSNGLFMNSDSASLDTGLVSVPGQLVVDGILVR